LQRAYFGVLKIELQTMKNLGFLCLILLSCLRVMAQSTLLNGLQACYPLDNNAINYAATGSAYNGTLVNTTQAIGHTNVANTAYKLNGTTSSYIVLPGLSGLKNNSVFFSGWFYIDSLPPEQYLVYTNNGCTFNFEAYSLITYYDFTVSQQVFQVSKANGSCQYAPQVQSSTAPSVGNWYHIGFFISQDTMKLYVNGVLEDQTSHTILFNYAPGKDVYIGVTNESNFNLPFKGRVDDVRFYNRQLTPAEVMTLYTTGAPCLAGSAPTASFTPSKKSVCRGQSIVLTDNSANSPTSWNWQMPGGNPANSAISNPTVLFANPGTYTITLITSNAFGSSAAYTQTVLVSECLSVTQEAENSSFVLYPNPNSGRFNVQLSESQRLRITDTRGFQVGYQLHCNGNPFCEVELADVPEGVYFICLQDANGVTKHRSKITILR